MTMADNIDALVTYWSAVRRQLREDHFIGIQDLGSWAVDVIFEAANEGVGPSIAVQRLLLERRERQAAKAAIADAPGTQQWAETMGGNLGESPDY